MKPNIFSEDEIKDLRKKQAEEGTQLKLIGSLKLNGESNGQISLGNAAELNERVSLHLREKEMFFNSNCLS